MNGKHLRAIIEATWPAKSIERCGPWAIRNGGGGGKRVSAATAEGDWLDEDIPLAEAEMAALGQSALFLIGDDDVLLDQALQARGYRIVDPVVAYSAPIANVLVPDLSSMAAFAHWPPLAVCRDMWTAGGIGPARWSVMDRATCAKCAILARVQDRPSGTAFVAIRDDTVMVHALEVPKPSRRQGAARILMQKAAEWGQENGAATIAVVVTVANGPARALYTSLGMAVCGQYHYRTR